MNEVDEEELEGLPASKDTTASMGMKKERKRKLSKHQPGSYPFVLMPHFS